MRSLFLIAVGLFLLPKIAAAQAAWLYAGYDNAFNGVPGAVYDHSGIVGFEYASKMLVLALIWICAGAQSCC